MVQWGVAWLSNNCNQIIQVKQGIILEINS